MCSPTEANLAGCSGVCWWPAQVPDSLQNYPEWAKGCSGVNMEDWRSGLSGHCSSENTVSTTGRCARHSSSVSDSRTAAAKRRDSPPSGTASRPFRKTAAHSGRGTPTIARELHDSAGQTLVALGMNLAQLAEDAKHNPAQLAKDVKDAQDLVQHLTQELRTTSYLLHPPMLDESGLSYALHWYVQGLAERSELNIDLKIPENFERLSPEMELVIFRLVQECLTNIHRHSGSKTALIRVVREADKIHVEVQDHGTGMSQGRFAEVQSQGAGVGIRGMRERVRQVHGELTIESNALGTKIFATFPAKTPSAKGQGEIQQLGVA